MPPTEKQTPKAPVKKKPAGNGSAPYATCEECGSPLDEKQRYCVSCGARRRDKGTPAVQYFATKGRRTRAGSGRGRSSGARAAAVLFFVLLPLAVAVGVLVGKGNSDDNGDLADAIASLQASGVSAGTTAAAAPATIASDFTLDKGYTVQLKTLPSSSDQAAVDAAKEEATSKGASDVGVINTSEFTLTPAPEAGAFVIYSGEFKDKGGAEAALKKLKAKFPDAQVVSVKRNADAGAGQLVAETAYGDVHKVEGFTPTAEKVASDQQVVDEVAKKIGKDYVDSQRNLPDVIVVGEGGGGSSNPAGQGNGD